MYVTGCLLDEPRDIEERPEMNSPIVPRGRYVLRLVDPLLPEPLYLDLYKSPITIGFCEGPFPALPE
jgi:hypothetical protein